MEEKRQKPRHRTLKPATIAFARAGGIGCTMWNLSETGACLEVETPIGIPDDFALIVKDEPLRDCHVTWRTARRIGVQFK